MNKLIKQKFKIEGMHCVSCAMNIDFDLEDLNGIKKSQTNFVKQETEVEFDAEEISLDNIVGQVKQSGYKATVIEEVS